MFNLGSEHSSIDTKVQNLVKIVLQHHLYSLVQSFVVVILFVETIVVVEYIDLWV